MLHGCNQDAADIAAGTRLDTLADREKFVVVYPEQSTEHNSRACWNWFRPRDQVRGSGEPALIAGITQEVLEGRSPALLAAPIKPVLDRDRVYITGLSAGASMAAILGATYPDLYAAVGMHSGSQFGAARNATSAMLAMTAGGPDPQRQGGLAYAAMGPRSRVVPVVVVQGDRDRAVRLRNGEHVVRQWLATNHLASGRSPGWGYTEPDAERSEDRTGALPATVRRWTDAAGRPVVEYWLVAGLGHAWSGGDPVGSYTDPSGPDATAIMHRFLSQHRLGVAPARPAGAVARRVPAVVARRVPAAVARRLPAAVVRRVPAAAAVLSRGGVLLSHIIGALLHPVQAARAVRRAVQPARRPRRPARIRR
jgi:poly(hydroxyalkanoate) depolymerase family esterase